jgi:hypothetical protein
MLDGRYSILSDNRPGTTIIQQATDVISRQFTSHSNGYYGVSEELGIRHIARRSKTRNAMRFTRRILDFSPALVAYGRYDGRWRA